jgi:hypothetical protein
MRPVRHQRGRVRGDAGKAQARGKPVIDVARQPHGLLVGHYRQPRGGAKRHDTTARGRPTRADRRDPRVDAVTYGVDDAYAVAVRHNARERHPYPSQSAPFFVSPGLIPEKATRTRTTPASGDGSAASPTCRTSAAGLGRSHQAASMTTPRPPRVSSRPRRGPSRTPIPNGTTALGRLRLLRLPLGRSPVRSSRTRRATALRRTRRFGSGHVALGLHGARTGEPAGAVSSPVRVGRSVGACRRGCSP